MNASGFDYAQKVILLVHGTREETSLLAAIHAVMKMTTLADRLACAVVRNGSPLEYAEIVRIHSRNDFPREG